MADGIGPATLGSFRLKQRVNERRRGGRRQNQQTRQQEHDDNQRQEPELAVLLQEAEELGYQAALGFYNTS